MEKPLSNWNWEVKQRIEKRVRKLKESIYRNIDTPIVANMRLEYLDLAIKGDDYMRKLRRSINNLFLDEYRFSALEPCESFVERFPSLFFVIENFIADRSTLVSNTKTSLQRRLYKDYFSLLIQRCSAYVIHRSARTIFYDFVDNVDFLPDVLFRIGFRFKLDATTIEEGDAFQYRTQNNKILDKLLVQHSYCDLRFLRYIRLLYPNPYFLYYFLRNIRRTEVLEYVLQMTYKAGVDIWGPSELYELSRDPILYFMSVQRYELVHTLIDYGYTICCDKRGDQGRLISRLFYGYNVTTIPFRAAFQGRFEKEPAKTSMILLALGHRASRRTTAFLSAYKRLHKSLGLPYYSASYIRDYLTEILNDMAHHQMIEERCYAYRMLGLEKYPRNNPRSLQDLAICAFRIKLKQKPCQLLPTEISQLEYSEMIKNLIALKT